MVKHHGRPNELRIKRTVYDSGQLAKRNQHVEACDLFDIFAGRLDA